MTSKLEWFKVLEPDELPEGRVKAVTCQHHTVCMSHFEGQFAALDNKCPHQGGPLGEGSIENGWLRCPWHGWDFHPITGKSPGDFDDGVDTFEVEQREDGVYVGFSVETTKPKTVSDLMVESLVGWGVKAVFGMVGHSNLGLADAIRTATERGDMRYVAIRHEGAASFACSAYGKLTGRPIACLSIAGPGATNLLTGLWDANIDRAPVIALTGQVDTQVLGPGAFQEIDLQAAYGKVAQWSQVVLPSSRHAELINLACKSAILNRGVSHLIFPDEVQTVSVDEDKLAGSPEGRLGDLSITPSEDSIDAASRLLLGAKRPVIIVGHGARFTMDSVTAFAEQHRIPVVTTFKGKGLIPDDHPLACGVLGRSGTPIASWFMNESDALLVLGASFSNHTGITPKKPTIQVDRDLMTLGKFHSVSVPVWGDIKKTLQALDSRLKAQTSFVDQRDKVQQRRQIWLEEKASRVLDDRGNGLNSAAVFAALTRVVPEDAIIAVDVGNNTYSFGRYFECKQQAILMSGYLGSIGFALPAAMGAWIATQEDDPHFHGRKVLSVSGDGGLGQYLAEITTLVLHKMDVTHVVLHNDELGKISKEQRSADLDVWQTKLLNPSFAAFATECGALGIRVESADNLDEALARAIAHPGPALVEIMTDATLV
ncbi:MAG: thiamine pyrophosphate-binding protein [Myxococcota bacterium]